MDSMLLWVLAISSVIGAFLGTLFQGVLGNLITPWFQDKLSALSSGYSSYRRERLAKKLDRFFDWESNGLLQFAINNRQTDFLGSMQNSALFAIIMASFIIFSAVAAGNMDQERFANFILGFREHIGLYVVVVTGIYWLMFIKQMQAKFAYRDLMTFALDPTLYVFKRSKILGEYIPRYLRSRAVNPPDDHPSAWMRGAPDPEDLDPRRG